MTFQIYYTKKGEYHQTMEYRDFKNIPALKRWYKKEYDNGKMEYSNFSAWDVKNSKEVIYKIRLKR